MENPSQKFSGEIEGKRKPEAAPKSNPWIDGERKRRRRLSERENAEGNPKESQSDIKRIEAEQTQKAFTFGKEEGKSNKWHKETPISI